MTFVDDADRTPPSPEALERLVAGHRDFLAFLTSRVRDRATAEEILQAAFVRTMEKGGTIRDQESAVAWFYRLLRNALVDHHRRRATEARVLDPEPSDPETSEAEAPPSSELRDVVCSCMTTLLPNLKPEYAEVLRRVDLEETPLPRVAADLAITTNNATVRLHRARQALRRQLEQSCGTCATHGCLDCTCAVRSM